VTAFFGGPLLPVIWAGIMAFVILAYVVLDGFDLGVGILFAVERDKPSRDVMVNTIAPSGMAMKPGWCWAAPGFMAPSLSPIPSFCRPSTP
jgi:hypothetical protein